MMYHYARSNHPEVLAAHRRNMEQHRAQHTAARALAREVGAEEGYCFAGQQHSLNGWHVTGFLFKEKPAGQWKRLEMGSDEEQGWAPFANSEVDQRMQTLRTTPEALPGAPTGSTRSGGLLRSWRGSAQAFEVDGWVYTIHTIGGEPIGQRGTYEDYGWEELTTTQMTAALDAFNEAVINENAQHLANQATTK